MTVTTFSNDREDAFTLIELLVVILVIGILAAIVIPSFINQRRQAVDATVKSDITNAGRLLAPEVLKGKSLTRTITITQASLEQDDHPGEFNISSLRVSPGTTLIIQPSQIDGGVCIFGVNPGGDVASKSPGFIYDSFRGGLQREGVTLVHSACTNPNGELVVPQVPIDESLEDPDGDPTTPPPGTDVVTFSGKLANRTAGCFATDYTLIITFSEGTLRWQSTGLERMNFYEGQFVVVELDKVTNEWVRSHVLTIDGDNISSGNYSGSIDIPPFDGNNLVLDDLETVFYGNHGYNEFHHAETDWLSRPINRTCGPSGGLS